MGAAKRVLGPEQLGREWFFANAMYDHRIEFDGSHCEYFGISVYGAGRVVGGKEGYWTWLVVFL